MHHGDKRLRPQAHAQHGGGEDGQDGEFATVDVLHFGHMRVGYRAENHAFVHPQRVCRAQNQRQCRQRAGEQVVVHRAHNHHKFAYEAGSGGQAGVGHGKQHHEGGKFRHHGNHAAVVGNVAAV